MNTFPPLFLAGDLSLKSVILFCAISHFLRLPVTVFHQELSNKTVRFFIILNLLEAEPWRITAFAFRCSRLSHESRHRLTYRAAQRAAKLAALQMCSWSSNIHAVWGDAKYFHERCKILARGRFRARSGGSGGTRRGASIHPRPSLQWVNDHRPHLIAVLCNSNSSSFPAAVYVPLKAMFMKVSVFLMSAPFDNSLSAELARRVIASHGALNRNIIRGYFFMAHSPLAFVYLLFTCMPLW